MNTKAVISKIKQFSNERRTYLTIGVILFLLFEDIGFHSFFTQSKVVGIFINCAITACVVLLYKIYKLNNSIRKFGERLDNGDEFDTQILEGFEAPCKELATKVSSSISELQKKGEETSTLLKEYSFLLENTSDIIEIIDNENKVVFCSSAVEKLLGYTKDEWMGFYPLKRIHPDDIRKWKSELKIENVKNPESEITLEGRFKKKNGEYLYMECHIKRIFDENGKFMQAICASRDISARIKLGWVLKKQANIDNLTGLPNRESLMDMLNMLTIDKSEQGFSLFIFDLDRFKQINDSYGHHMGDKYLTEVSKRIKETIRPSDILGRMGGDEFVLICPTLVKEEIIENVAKRIIQSVSKPFVYKGNVLHPKISMGVAIANPGEAGDGSQIMQNADRALYEVKNQGGNAVIIYNEKIGNSLKKEFEIEQKITDAIASDRLVIHFQPIVNVTSKLISIAEALVRLKDANNNLISPAEFIPIAEKTGLIIPVGDWVLEQACLESKRMTELGCPIVISVNVSPKQLKHVNYVEKVKEIIEKTKVDTSKILLEVTESAFLEDVKKTKELLLELKSLGFKLALDDFGTGYSSISLLRDLPFDILKIDRYFVKEMGGNKTGIGSLSSILDIGKIYKMTIIAEGIENEEQSDTLEKLGCDLLQGFLFYKPMESNLLEKNALEKGVEDVKWREFNPNEEGGYVVF